MVLRGIMKKTTKQKNEYIVYHNIWSIDKCVFPGTDGDNPDLFFHPETWTEVLINTIHLSEKLCLKYNIKLTRGGVNYEAGRTELIIRANDESSISAFYQDFSDHLTSSYGESLEFIDICLNPEEEIHDTLDKLKQAVAV